MKEVLSGAASWQARQWLTSFYPQDLPSEWQMSYYANEFSTTCIKCHEYCDAQQLDLLAEMLEGCHAGFRPVLFISASKVTTGQVSHFFRWLDKIDEDMGIRRLAGVWLSGEGQINDRSALSAWRQGVPQEIPVALDGNGQFDNEDRQWLQDQQLSPVWRAGQPSTTCWLAEVSLADDSRALAGQVRDFLGATTDSRPSCVIASSGYEDITKLRELSTIVRLISG